jgi:arylsulfatase A-like enzyme
MNRREFMQRTALGTAGVWLAGQAEAQEVKRPNILWITSEDHGPHLGCYGDTFADTPNLDGLAAKGMLYKRAWSTAPVCAPARTTIISGVYPPSLGAEHMRSQVPLPSFMKMYPQYLRESGYYCTNNSKEDYNLAKPGKVWDVSSRKGHWKNRKAGQPFFAIFNFTMTHESRIRSQSPKFKHDPSKVPVPAYHPDTPEVRSNWTQYYDRITEMDNETGRILKEVNDAGLAEDTIVFFYADHGAGMPRGKRWPYNSGLHVPMILYLPEKWQHLTPPEYKPGGKSDRLVGFIDLAPTALSLAGIKPPAYMQGHAFAGRYCTEPPKFMYGFRGRMDERYDLVRTVTDGRYVYLRHYMPHKIYGQYINYMFVTQTTQVWKKMYDEGKLNAAQKRFWEKKPPEELYDLENDPDEVNNLADSPTHQLILKRLQKAQQELAVQIRDVGFLPEDEIHSRSRGSTPYEIGHDPQKYPLEKIMRTAELASSLDPKSLDDLVQAMTAPDSAVRYWGALGILMQEKTAVMQAQNTLRKAMSDSSPSVRVIAAQALGQYGTPEDAQKALAVLLEYAPLDKNSVFVSLPALNALDAMNERARSAKDQIAAISTKGKTPPRTSAGYVKNLIKKTLMDLE